MKLFESETVLEDSRSFSETLENMRTTQEEDTSFESETGFVADESDDIVSYLGTMSLGSDTLQDFGSLVSLPPGTISGLFQSDHLNIDEGSQTILSSEPSNATIPPPEPYREPLATTNRSPRSLLTSESIRSLSTVSTDIVSYEDLLRVAEAFQNQRNSHPDSCDTSIDTPTGSVRTSRSIQQSFVSEGHDPVAFVAVANRLMRDSVRGGRWYGNFTEEDWEQFQHVAKMILTSLEPSRPARLALPPSPPECTSNDSVDCTPYQAMDYLPPSFVCPLCSDAVVGAFTLDCGCPVSTVCTLCWESHIDGTVPRDTADSMNFVWVEHKKCPSCDASVETGVPCHALDVAILRIVESLSDESMETKSLKKSYYERLAKWGEEVVRRHEEHARAETERQDRLLAQLIQNEEKVIWERQRKREADMACNTNRFLMIGQAAVAVFVATVASIGVSSLSRR